MWAVGMTIGRGFHEIRHSFGISDGGRGVRHGVRNKQRGMRLVNDTVVVSDDTQKKRDERPHKVMP